MTDEQHRVLNEIHDKENEITELNKKLFDLKEKENNSVKLLKELDEEVKEKTKQAEYLGSKISDLLRRRREQKKTTSGIGKTG